MTANAPAPASAPNEIVHPARTWTPWAPWLTLLACAAILFARRPSALLCPQFYCEDGMVYFTAARAHGFASQFEIYAGYQQLVPRIVAWIASLFDPRYAPFI